jgi:hypothetical protein
MYVQPVISRLESGYHTIMYRFTNCVEIALDENALGYFGCYPQADFPHARRALVLVWFKVYY